MANPYFTFGSSPLRAVPVTIVRDRQFNGALDAVEQGFDLVDGDITNLEAEIVAARDGQATLLDSLQLRVTWTLTQDIDAGLSYRIRNLPGPVDSGDVANKAYVDSVAAAGGSPSAIAITDLNPGTATSSQLISVSADGTAVIGISQSSLPLTGFSTSGLLQGQLLGVSATGTLESRSESSIAVTSLSPGTAVAGEYIRVKADGSGLESGTVPTPPISDLSPGTLAADQLVVVDSSGSAIVGRNINTLPVSDMSPGTLAPDGYVMVNPTGTSLVSKRNRVIRHFFANM